jgi:hypothetical protein
VSVSLADVQALGAEVADMGQADFDALLPDCVLLEKAEAWGEYHDYVLKRRIAHEYFVGKQSGGGTDALGPINRITVGGVSVGYAVQSAKSSSGDIGLSDTRFGQAILDLRRRLGVHMAVV